MFKRAIVRHIPDNYISCLSSHPKHDDLNLNRTREQHTLYIQLLRELGLEVIELPALRENPDCPFVEDTAVIYKSRAVITNMGVLSRKTEVQSIAEILQDYFSINFISSPATIEGGDVLHFSDRLISGMSQRTNKLGIEQTSSFLSVPISTIIDSSIMHLKSYVSYLDEQNILVTEKYANNEVFSGLNKIIVPKAEIYAANALSINGSIIIANGFPQTEKILKEHSYDTIKLQTTEFAKCDGALTCLSLLF